MTSALLYLRLTSLANLVMHRIRRLKQPKYVMGTVAAIAYFYFFVGRRFGQAMASSGPMMPATMSTFATMGICILLTVVGLLRLGFAWASPTATPGFRFSEAEIAFLFPAPIPRKTLIHYRLLSAQLAILFTSVLIAVVFNRSGFMGSNRVMRALGWWVILATFDLHLNGTNLLLHRLKETSPRYVMWRVLVVGGIILYAGAILWSVCSLVGNLATFADMSSGSMDRATDALAREPLFHWLTLPLSILFGPYAATSARGFAVAMVPALLLLVINYRWVLNTEARFEEGSIAIAEKRAAAKAAAQRGEIPRLSTAKQKERSGPFPLAPTGLPEVAFLWKNLLSMRSSVFSRRAFFILFGIVGGLSMSFGPMLARHSVSPNADVIRHMVVIMCAIVSGYTVFLGPQLARQDLRSDLPNADLLKTYPMEGWKLALGELLAPTVLLSVILWCAILISAILVDSSGEIEWLTTGVRLTFIVCLGFAAPLLCLIQLIVPNSIMVLFPSWYQSSRSRSAGIEMFGQRLIFGFVQMFFALTVVLPAAGFAVLVFFCSKWLIGISPAVILSTLAIVPMLGGEVAVGLWFLGDRFEKFDLTAESR